MLVYQRVSCPLIFGHVRPLRLTRPVPDWEPAVSFEEADA